MNNLRGVYTIWYRDILRFWHDKMRMIGSITFPLLFLFVFGSGLSTRMGFLSPGVDFTQFMFPGIIGMTVLMSSFMCGENVGRGNGGIGSGGHHPTIRTPDWCLAFGMDSAGIVAADVPARCFYRLSGYPAGHAHQVYGGVSGSDADVDVSYGVPIWGVLPTAGAAGMDEYPGEAQSRYLRHRPNPPGNTGSRAGVSF